MKNNNSVLKMVLTLVVIAVVSAGAMSYVNKITAPIIAQRDAQKLQNALGEVLKADGFSVISETESLTVYEAVTAGEISGYCIVNLSAGYGGDLKIMTGVDLNGAVTGVSILSHSETAGLGANADKPEFKEQYKGKTSEISVSKTKASENEIKALSGATVTSEAVTKAVNEAIAGAEKYLKGGEK